ncbi:MAG: large conductance mechanosensitive channel protein MscL [Candidatus Humimicrobiaceae bacterium]
MWKEFKNFVIHGNAMELAIGIIIGVAFGGIVNSLVNDIIMPPIGLALGKVDFVNLFAVLREGSVPGPYLSLEAAKAAGAITINYGFFINTIISFILIALVIFFIVKAINNSRKKEAVPTKTCPFCFTTIDIKATKCPNCTSGLA